MSAPTVEDLRRQIAEEAAAHQAAMAAIIEQTRKFQSVLSDDQQAFSDLITRVTNLRVAKGELLAARAADRTQTVSFNTGSDLLDSLLYAIQAKLDGPAGVSSSDAVLQKLETAALEATTPYTAHRVSALFTSNQAATRTTGVLFLFPNDVRGVRVWARRHMSNCPSCSARLQQLPPWTPHRYDSKAAGFAAAPNLRAIPNKRYHRVSCSLLQERSMAARVDAEDQLDLVRSTFFLHVQQANESKQPLADSAAACTRMTAALQEFLQTSMEALRTTARTTASWNVGPTVNADFSAAIEILLHMVVPRAHVQPVHQPAVTRHGMPCTLVQVDVAVSVPLQVSAIAPLLQLLRSAEQRRYVIEHVLTPLAGHVGEALGLGREVSHYTSVGLQFAEALYRIAVHHGIVSGDYVTSTAAPPAAKTAHAPRQQTGDTTNNNNNSSPALTQLYTVLQALAVFGTTVEVELATPPLGLDKAALTSQEAKKAALRLAQSVLEHFAAPSPLTVPPPNDPTLTDMTVKISRAPTTFLEILNRTFSSNHRLPSTSRGSALDTFMSPKSKISLGLKLFRELVVDVYRPYSPCTGVVLASENGANGRPRAPPCVPVIDLPVDCVSANTAVAAYVAARLQALRERLSAVDAEAAVESALEKAGRAALQDVAARLHAAAPVAALRAQWSAVQATVVGVPKACVDVVVPYSMSEVDVRAATKPLLYARIVYES